MKPILFSTPMVQAILDGRKTMTRRVIKSSKIHYIDSEMDGFDGYINFAWLKNDGKEYYLSIFSKYQVGDILWVRETWAKWINFIGEEIFVYKVDKNVHGVKWKPSIFMPKEACRIFLRVTNVRVERLQDITGDDAKKEGIEICTNCPFINPDIYDDCLYCDIEKTRFSFLWNSINGKGAWESNPYVFVYEFERVEKPKDNA